jgi:hypothetical protein
MGPVADGECPASDVFLIITIRNDRLRYIARVVHFCAEYILGNYISGRLDENERGFVAASLVCWSLCASPPDSNDWLLATVRRNDGDANVGAEAPSQNKCHGSGSASVPERL